VTGSPTRKKLKLKLQAFLELDPPSLIQLGKNSQRKEKREKKMIIEERERNVERESIKHLQKQRKRET
jgi:hypothetical protein